jgi:hypothetical protein
MYWGQQPVAKLPRSDIDGAVVAPGAVSGKLMLSAASTRSQAN